MPDARGRRWPQSPGPTYWRPAARPLPARPPLTVSVVVPSRGGWERINTQLEALAGQDFPGPLEVVVSNNDGDPRLNKVVEQHASQDGHGRLWRVVNSSHMPGVSGARNVGCCAATGELLLICDDDDVVAEGWASAMVAQSPEAHVLGGRLLPWSPRGRDSDLDFRSKRLSEGLPNFVDGVPYAVGANCAVWREVFLEIEGWSDAYRGGGDDIDFCIRAQLAGFVIGYVPEASVNYAAKPGLKAALLQQIRYGAGIRTASERLRGGASRRAAGS